MITLTRLHQILALPLAMIMFLSTFPIATVQAKMVGTDDLIAEQGQVDSQRAQVKEFMAREDVRAQMEKLGVDPDEAMSRVDSLSDSEIQQIAGRINELPAGQAIGAIVGALVLVFVILLITDLLCLTKFFPFTRCAR